MPLVCCVIHLRVLIHLHLLCVIRSCVIYLFCEMEQFCIVKFIRGVLEQQVLMDIVVFVVVCLFLFLI